MDVHDAWQVEYRSPETGNKCQMTRRCRYRVACWIVREVRGKIVGRERAVVPGNETEQFS